MDVCDELGASETLLYKERCALKLSSHSLDPGRCIMYPTEAFELKRRTNT